MPLQIRTKDITLSTPQEKHLKDTIESFKKYSLDITRVIANITNEKNGIHVEFEIHIAHTSPIIVNEVDETFDKAVELAKDRVLKALRRLHDKIISSKKRVTKEEII